MRAEGLLVPFSESQGKGSQPKSHYYKHLALGIPCVCVCVYMCPPGYYQAHVEVVVRVGLVAVLFALGPGPRGGS